MNFDPAPAGGLPTVWPALAGAAQAASMAMPGSSVCRCAARTRCTACATSVCITKATMLLLSLRSAGSGDAASALVISAQALSAAERVARAAGRRRCWRKEAGGASVFGTEARSRRPLPQTTKNFL